MLLGPPARRSLRSSARLRPTVSRFNCNRLGSTYSPAPAASHAAPASSAPVLARSNMPDLMQLTFLGTAAGKPCSTRNVSSLALKIDRQLWVVDAGEGTQHQFIKSKLKMSHVTKIFVTHMHADHIMGLPGLLCTISAGEGSVLPGQADPRLESAQSPSARPIEIYGPSGLRAFLRTCLALTQSILSRPFSVHELLFSDDKVESGELHPSEQPGRSIRPDQDGFWRDFVDGEKERSGMEVSAGPILHTVPCIGFVFNEQPRPLAIEPAKYVPHLKRPINADALRAQGIMNPLSLLSRLTRERQPIQLADGTVLEPPPLGGPGRKIVVLGDTYDARAVVSLAPDCDLLVHESTNAFLPELDESQSSAKLKDGKAVTRDSVRQTAKEHGHSTPEVAGELARSVRAKRLVLNHLSVKYPAVPDQEQEGDSESTKNVRLMLREIEKLASDAWGGGQARVASDFLEIDVPRRDKVQA